MYTVFSYLLWHSHLSRPMYQAHWGCMSIETAAAAVKSRQLCPTLGDPIDGSPPGSAVPGILQARTLEWIAISFSSAWKWKVKVKSLSHVWLFATPWTAAHQAPPSIEFSRQEYWSGLPLLSRSWVSGCANPGTVLASPLKKKDTVGHPEVVADLFSQNLTQERHCHL